MFSLMTILNCRIEPANIRSHLNLGNALFAEKDIQGAEQVYRKALKQVEEELFDQADVSHHLANPTISPLYLTALVRLAELINDSSTNELEQIKYKMASFHTMMSMSVSNDKSHETSHYTPSYGSVYFQTKDQMDRSIKLSHLYNVSVIFCFD